MLSNPGRLVYGSIAVGAVLSAESAIHETYLSTLAAAIIALALYWLAHSYAEFTELRAEQSQPLKLEVLLGVVRRETSILAGAAVPLLSLVICWVAQVRLTSAVVAATWVAAVVVVLVELVVGVKDRLAPADFVAQTAVGIILGLLVIALRVLLHGVAVR